MRNELLEIYEQLMIRFSVIVEKMTGNIESQEPPFVVGDINGEHDVIDLRTSPETSIIFNELCTEKDVRRFNQWLRTHADDYVRLYHGTASKFDIRHEGLKKTTAHRRHSYQSTSGFVYLSIYPSSARTFGEMAYPGQDVTVYAVDIKIRELRPDTNQLVNRRRFGYGEFDHIGNTLADSLIFGHGARVSRAIRPWEIKQTDY